MFPAILKLQKYNVEKIGLFGSYARDEATKDSDVDVNFTTFFHPFHKNLPVKKCQKQALKIVA
jgi:predicted nucleotidyltransferase